MTNRFKNIFIRLLKFSIFFGSLSIVFFSVFAQQPDEGEILFEVETTPVIQTSAQEIPLLIGLANNFKDRHQLILKDIKINKGDKTIEEIFIYQPLFPVRDKLEQIEALGQELENVVDESKGRAILKQISVLGNEISNQSFSTTLRIKVADFITLPQVGEQFSITLIANLIHNSRAEKITKNIVISFASPLPKQANWYVGDGHVHSAHSEWDASYWYRRGRFFVPGPTVSDQALAAKNFGLEWLIMTDHEDMLDSAEWLLEKTECEIAEAIYNFPVMIGEEVGSVIPKISQGHYLAYDINSYVDASPFSAQDLINKTKEAGGFGFIAHPDTRPFPWKDWDVTGYKGYELLRGEDKKVKAKTIHRWDDQLKIGQKPVIIGNSDAHWPADVGETRTYLHIEGPITHNSIYNALKNSNAILTNGPLLILTINDATVGQTTNVPPGEQATLNIQWTSNEEFGPMKEISIISKDGKVLDRLTKNIQSISGSATVSYPVSEATYFRLVGQSSNGQVVYTNPIFITNYPITPPPIWSPAVNVSNNTGISVFPDITSDVFSYLHLVWVDNTSGNFEILYSMWDGTNWSEPLNISNTPGISNHPAISSDIFGRIHVVWEEGVTPQNTEIFYITRDITWSFPVNISNTPGYSSNPDIIVDNLGYPHIVWNDQPITPAHTVIFYTKKYEGGWISPINISKKLWGHSVYPAIALDNFQYPHVVWQDDDTQEIFYTTWNGIYWFSPINISDTSEYSGRPDIVAVFNNLHVIWTEIPPLLKSEIFYASKKEGEDWSLPINISNTSGSSGCSRSSLISDGLGYLYVVWNDFTYENGEIFYSRLDKTGWSIPLNISNNPRYSRWPAITSNNSNLHVVWDEMISYDNWEIFYSYSLK